MTNLQDLLNKLISLGRKPYGLNFKKIEEVCGLYYLHPNVTHYSLNDLCSIDSGLWQFVCGLDKDFLPFCSKCSIKLESNNDKIKGDTWYEEEVNYRLMLSSIQTDKEKFLLDNIKV